MAQAELLRLVPNAPQALCDLLDDRVGVVLAPIRAEIFGPDRFARHGSSLGESHRNTSLGTRARTFFPRLRSKLVRAALPQAGA